MSEVTVFEGGRDGYHTYRIPAILGAADGALLAFCEGRTHNAADTGDIDIVLRRSTDEGRTWGPLILAVDYGPHAAGNPSPILDRRTGRIVLLFNQNFVQDDQTAIQNGTSTATRSAWVCYSDDQGLSWSQPLENTDQVKLPDWRWLAFGPTHGIQLERGPHAGRTKNLFTELEHGDVVAHVEFMVPQGSNSGVYFQGRYEIQVFDSWRVEELKHGDCGGIYQRWKDGAGYEGHPPRVNAAHPPGAWQSFDVVFRAPRFDATGKKVANARFIKVVHNGVLVHENVEVTGPTRAAAFSDEKPLGPLMLQGDHGPVAYRNLSIEPLND